MIEIMVKPNDNPEDVLEFIKTIPDQEQENAIRAAVVMGRLGKMINKTCKTCVDNEYGICDRLGWPVGENDACELHRVDWREGIMQRFLDVK